MTYDSAAVRAAVFMNRPVQYFSPGLRLLAENADISLRVYYWQTSTDGDYDPGFGRHIRWNADLYSGYEWWSPATDRPDLLRVGKMLRQLRTNRPDVILTFGWHSPASRVGILYARATGTPLLFYGDTTMRGTTIARRQPRRLGLQLMFRGSGAISTGAANLDFYFDHGIPPQRIHPGVLPVDVESFVAAAEGAADKRRNSDRPFRIGFVGKFIPRKAIDDLIEAVSMLPSDTWWELWLIGDGPLRTELISLVARRGLGNRVRFLGFKNTHEVPALVAVLDVLVLPSRYEPRGLVAIEAMAAGVVAVVSSATGVWGPDDAIQDGETGQVFPVGDVPALAAILLRLMNDPRMTARVARKGQDRALSLGFRDFAETTARALMSTARSRLVVNT